LLVGVDTRPNDGSTLNTDTIMVLSYNHKTGDIVMISIPRDFFVGVQDQGWYTKVNALYSIGENEQKGQGMSVLKEKVQQMTGLELQYFAMIDFTGFQNIVDTMGGVDVEVDESFTGYMESGKPYPYQWDVYEFTKGTTHMDGATALAYARLRHAYEPDEASDFARARRQQAVIMAIKSKALSSQAYLDPHKILDLISVVQDDLKLSQITTEDIQAAINIASSNQTKRNFSFVLDPSVD